MQRCVLARLAYLPLRPSPRLDAAVQEKKWYEADRPREQGCLTFRLERSVTGLPTAAALVPEPKKISEAIVPKAGHMDEHWCAEDRGKPALTRRSSPNCNCDICTNNKPSAFIHGMQTPTHIIHIGAKSSERLRFDIDVAEFDRGRLDGGDEFVALPSDSCIADRAFCIVPDGECGPGRSKTT